MDNIPINSYPDEVARKWKTERDALVEFLSKDNIKEIIDEWITYWMNQTQNNEQDYQNYLRRAMAVDANMRHHLAILISDKCLKRIQGEGSGE